MPNPLRIQGMLVEPEVTYATDPTPSASTDGVRIVDRVWGTITPDYAFPHDRDDDVTGTLRPRAPGTPKGRMATLDFGVKIKGSGAAYDNTPRVVPEGHGSLLPACGKSEAIVTTGGSESVTYAPADSSFGSVTIWCYAGGHLFKVVGCRGTDSVVYSPGLPVLIRYRMQGLILDAAEPTDSALASITYAATPEEPAAVSLGLAFGGWTPASIGSFTFDAGVQVVQSDDVQAAQGIEGFDVSEHRPESSIEVYNEALATINPYDDAEMATARTLSLTLGSTQYNRFKLNAAPGYIREVRHFDRNGFAGWRIRQKYTDYRYVWD